MDDSVIQAGVDSFLAGEKANKEAALRNNFVNSSGTSPDDFAKQIALSKATNIPIQSLMADPVEAAKHRALVNTDFSGLVTSSPLTADFLLDPKNAGIARDDTDSLSAMEQTGNFLKSFIGGFGAAVHGINTGGWGMARAASENFVEPISGAFGSGFGTSLTAYIQRLRKASEADYATTQNFGGDLSEMGVVKRGFFNAVSSAVQSTLTLPAALEFKMAEGGLALSSAIRAIAPLGAVQGGLAYTEARDKGVGKGTSLAYAGAQAATEVWTELLPMGRLIKDLGVGAPLWKTLRNQLVTENVGEQFATHFQDLNTWLTVNPEKTLKDYLNERPNAALETLIATTFATGMQTTAAHLAVRSMQQSNTLNRAAENGATQTEEMFAAAARSLVGQRSPETLKAFLEHLAPDATVLVDSTKLSEVLAQTGVDIGVLPTAQAQLENPEFVGAGVEIPYSELITGLVGTEAEKAIIPHLRFDANMPTLAEAQEYDTQAAAFFQQEADRILTEESKNQEFMDGAQAVQDDLFNQLSEVGRNGPQVNNGYAKLGAAFYSVLAKEFGVTPLQIRDGWTDAAGVAHRGYGLKIGGEPNAAAGLSQLSQQTETPEFKNWFGDSKVVGEGGTPRVMYHGTAKAFTKVNMRKGAQGVFWMTSDKAAIDRGEVGASGKGTTMELFVKIENPAGWAEYGKHSIGELKRNGYDGIILPGADGTITAVAFDPKQVKSATRNRGTFDPNDPNILHQTFQTVTPKQTDAYRADVAWTDTGEENGFPTWKSVHVELANPRDVTEGHDIFYLPKEDARAVKYDIKAPDGRTVGHTVLEVSDGWPTMLLDIETNPGERGNRYAEYTVAAIANDVGELAVWHIVPEARSWWERQGTAPVDEFNGALTFNDYADARASRENPRGVGGNVAFNQPAYHGSPYKFDKFSLEHMGKGEGAQAFGWGLYFAGDKGVAEWYRSQLTRNALKVSESAFLKAISERFPGGVIPDAAKNSANLYSFGFKIGRRGPAETIRDGALLAIVDEAKTRGIDIADLYNAGQLYAVDIPGDDTMLHWDKPISEQPKAVRAALEPLMQPEVDRRNAERARMNTASPGRLTHPVIGKIANRVVTVADIRGQAAYEAISSAQGSDEAASKYLNSLGISGIKYLDGQSRNKGEGAYNYVVFDDNAVQLLDTFYQTESAPLGSFSPETLDLNLLAGANYTTFVHELGHFFLTAYADIAAQEGAPKKIVDDMNAMLAQFGIADLATWNVMSLEDQRQYHEQIAESFEQYVFTGKAPSLELQPLFSTMLSWFKRVYQSLKDFVATHSGAKLNPELSAVFDRMLATDAEIASANEARGYVALFKDAAEAGMSDKDFAAYTALADAQREDAESMLRTRSLRDMKWLQARRNKIIAELQKDAAEKRADMRKTVAAEVRAEPIRQAERYLKHGVILNDVGSDVAPLGPNKLQISEVRDLYPAEALTPAPDWTKLGYGKYGMLAEVGLSPAEVAERFGLPSGPDLVETLLAQQPLNAEIESRTDQRMLEAYGDITAPDVLARAADEAIHNDFRTRAVATELSALAANIGAPSVLMKAAKEYARQVLETKTSKTIRPWSYAAAETRAGKAAMAALKKGDRETAAIEKRTELVNHVTAKEAYAVEKEIKKIVDRFKKLAAYNNESSAVKSRDFATVQAIRSLLADHGIGSKGDAAQDYLETVKEHDPIAAQRLQDILAVTGENPKDWADIKLADLREFSVAIDDLWFAAARTRQMEVQGKLVAQQDVADELLATLVEQGIPTRVPGEGWAPTKTEKLGMKFGAAKAVLRRMEFVANVLDGNRTVGPWLKNIVGVIQDATAAMNVAKGETLKTFESLLDTIRPSLKRGEIAAPELGYIFGKGPSGSGRAELLHAILHTGNESNMRKMLLGREWAVELPNGALDTTKWDSFVARMKTAGYLTKADYDFAQGVWNLMDSLKPAAQKAHRAVFGKFFSEVTAKPFTNEFGTYAGGYVPALTDSDIVKDNELRNLREDAFQGMEFSFPAPMKGFTNARVEGYTRALKLDLGSLNSHISQVLLFSHMAVPVSDVQRVLARPEISGAINRLYPSMLKATIIPWLNRVAKNTTSSTSADFVGLGRFLRTARSNAGVNTMMGSLSNSIQQLVGILPASVAIEGKYLRRAVVYNLTSPGETAEYVKSLSPYMQTRMDNEAYAALDNIDQILTNPNVYESTVAWTRRHAYFMQSAVDNFLSPTIWIAAYNQALEKDVSKADAVHIADSLIRQTQGASGAADIATFEAGHPFMQLFTQFTGYFNMMAQFLHGQMVKNMAADVGLPKKYARAFYIVGIGFFAQAVAAELVSMLFRGGPEDDDKDGSTIDEWLVQLGVMAPLKFMTATVPFLGTALQVSINKWNNKSYDDKMMNSPAISTLEQGLGAPVAAYKAVFEEGKPSTAIRGFAGIIGLFTGLPTALVARPVGYLADVAAGKVEPTSTPDMVRGIITGTASPDSKQ